jgi:hypothetical protein
MVKQIHIPVSDDEHAELKDKKGNRTWKEVLMDGAEV